tara:strand:+ start:655 stop:858 length:204 start_codon:yes stop_codon:yes gene_type:complete
MKIGINYHLQFRMIIEDLQKQLDKKTLKLQQAERKLKKYENNNTRTTGNGKNNNIIKFSRSIPTTRD